MFGPLIARARYGAATAGIGFAAAAAILIGLAFWTLALWLFLISLTTALTAAVILAALYTGAGLIGFGAVSTRRRRPPVHPRPTTDTLMGAFMSGVKAGASTRRR